MVFMKTVLPPNWLQIAKENRAWRLDTPGTTKMFRPPTIASLLNPRNREPQVRIPG